MRHCKGILILGDLRDRGERKKEGEGGVEGILTGTKWAEGLLQEGLLHSCLYSLEAIDGG